MKPTNKGKWGMGKRICCLGLTLAALLSLPSCRRAEPEETPEPTHAPVLTEEEEQRGFVLPCYPAGGFHPITGTNRLNLTLAPLMYRGLFALDQTFTPQNDLCESYTVSDDGLVWTFHLKVTTFSDSTPLTAGEAAASLELARHSSRFSGRLSAVSRIAAEGTTVVVTLSKPNGALPTLLDIPIVKETGDPLRPLGTGPYMLAETEEGLALVARAGGEDLPAESISLRSIGAGDDLVYAFDAREISLVDTDLTGTSALGYSSRFEMTDYPTTSLLYVGFNLRSGACREAEVRRAISRAADREIMAQQLLAGHAVASTLPIHPGSEYHDATLAAGLDFDMEEADRLLTAADWQISEEGQRRKGRSDLTLKLLVNQDNTYKVTVAEALAASLRELGCIVTVSKLPWEEFVAALTRREFDLYLGETTLTADFDLEALLAPTGSLNYGGYADGETTALLEACRSARGEERRQATEALCARVAEEVPILPICFKNGSLLTQWGQVSGAAPTQRDVFAGLENWRINTP